MLISRGMTPHSGVWHLSVTHCNFRDRVRLGVDDGCCGNSDVSEEDLSTWGPIRPAINTAADLTIKTRLPDLRPPTHQLYWQISIPCHYPCCDLQTLQHLAPDGGRAGPDLTTSWVSAINYKHKHLDQVLSQVFLCRKLRPKARSESSSCNEVLRSVFILKASIVILIPNFTKNLNSFELQTRARHKNITSNVAT